MALVMMPRLTWQPHPDGTKGHPTVADNIMKLGAVAGAMPNAIAEVNGVLDLRPFCAPIDNQLQLSDCVADSTCSALEFCQIRDGEPFVKKARLFVYYNARLQTQSTDQDNGTFIKMAFVSLTQEGVCSEATWPYDPAQVNNRPSWAAYQEALPNRTSNFYAIGDNAIAAGGQDLVNAVKQALQAQHPVVFGMVVDQDYMAYSGGVVSMPASTRVGQGGHAQMIAGYDNNRQCWLVQNSWGPGWGEGGFAWVPWAYLDASQANDMWVPVR